MVKEFKLGSAIRVRAGVGVRVWRRGGGGVVVVHCRKVAVNMQSKA